MTELPLSIEDYRELAAFLEQHLTDAQSLTQAEMDGLRLRLVALYVQTLRDPDPAAKHADELLRRDAIEAKALELTSALLDLYREVGNPAGALGFIEPLVVSDPGNDGLRRRYIDTAASLGEQVRAAAVLRAALRGPRGADVHERVGFDLGTIYLQEGELRQARQAFLDVVLLDAGGPETLDAARRLLDLEPDPGDPDLVAPALEAIAKADPDASSRQAAATRLLSLHAGKPLDEARVAVAFQTMVDSPRAEEALAWLQSFYERSGDARALAGVYRKQATLARSPADAQALALRSIKLLWGHSNEEAAIKEWLWLVEAFGPHREAHAKLIAFFARAERWEEHGRMLEADIDLAPPEQRAQRLVQLGQTRLARLGDASAALAAFGRCLAMEPANEAARQAVEGLMAKGDQRLAAARILEPIYKTLGLREGELRALETRAELAPDATSRAAALAAAVDVAAGMLEGRPDDSHVRTQCLALCSRALEADPSSPSLLRRMDELLSGRESSSDWLARHEAALKGATDPDRRRSLMLAIAAALTKDVPPDGLLGVCRRLIDEPGLDPLLLRVIADTARDEDDKALQRRALELLTGAGDAETSKQAHERLGDLFFLQGDRRAAAESWRPAAHLCDENPAERQHAQLLYERVLEALPDDGDAAARLSELYAHADDWLRIPEVLRVLIRANDRRPIPLLLRLEKSAIEAGAVDEFVSLADGVLARVGVDAPEQVCDLKRARARALRSEPARHDQAVLAYRDLVESSQNRKDMDEFESFVESSPSAEERHRERRWLYEWHTAHSAQPADVLTEWAKAEEENGETDAAIDVYRRLSEADPSRIDAFEGVCRLKFQAGDFEGGLAVLPTLSDGSGSAERRAVHLRMARLLLDELGRPAEAAAALAPLIGSRPVVEPARQMARRMLADPGSGGEVAERLERFASAAAGATSSRIFEFLVESREATATMTERRQRWLQRLVEVRRDDPAASLSAAVKGAVELPEVPFFWDAAERIARELGQADVVASAYHDVLVDGDLEPAFAEALARRMVTFEGECATQSSRVTSALLKVLERAPGARWALDRVKLALGSQARYGELLRLYDGAIAAARSDAERGELLEEAAFAARDLAGEPERAIPYLESIRALRPDDLAVGATLERLYERQGQKIKLVELYDKRLEKASGFELRELRRKTASLRVDLGDLGEAVAVVEQMLEDDASAPEVIDLLERIADLPAPKSDSPAAEDLQRAGPAALAQEQAIALLRRHYEGLGRAQDVVRVAERQLALSDGAEQRAECEKDLIRILEEIFESDRGGGIASQFVERLAQLLDATGQHAKLAKLWDDQARVLAKTGTAAEQSACYRRAAELWERQENWKRAIEAYRRGAALESEDCFEALARIYAARGAWADAAKVLDWLQANGTTQDRGLLAIRSAEAYMELGERGRARACLEDALNAAPEIGHSDDVRERLLALYRQDAVWKPLASLLATEARRVDDPAKKIALAREASELLRDRLDDPAGAAALLELAVGWDPNDEALRLSLVDLLEVLERWDQIVAALTDQIKRYGEHRSRERALAHHRLARALVRGGRPKEALAQLRLAAEMVPAHPGVLSDLGRVAMEVGDLELSESTYRVLLLTLQHKTEDLGTLPPHRADVLLELSEVSLCKGDSVRANDLIDSAFEAALESGGDLGGLEKTLEGRGRHDALARAIERRLERASELPARSIALADLLGLWVRHLGRPADLGSRILHHAERIGRELDHDAIADAGARTALACVHASLGNPDQALGFLESAVAKMRPGERFADCLERWIPIDREAASALARGLLERRDRQGDQTGAARALEIGFSADPQNAAFHDRMLEWLRACRASGDHREVLRLLDGAIANSVEDSDLLSQRASVRADLGDDDGAIADLERASVVDTRHVDALVELLVRVHGSASPATDAHAIRLVDLLTRANRPAEARRELERLLERNPGHPGGLERIAALAFAEGSWDAAAEAYGKLLPMLAGGTRDEIVRVVMAMADACEHAGRLAEAREALDRAHAVAPESLEIAERLERTCEKLEDWTALARLLQARAGEQRDAAEKTRLLLRAGQLLLERARDPSRALAVIDLARASGPESMEGALLWSRTQMALGQPREALAVLANAAERGRGRRTALLARVYFEMGKAHLAMDEIVEALVALKSALSTNGRVGEIAMLLGLVAIDLDEPQTAERALMAVTTMASRKEDTGEGADPALKAAAFYRLASMAHEKGELAKAKRLASRAVGGDPEHQAARALLDSLV